jgi:hypothetical protein
MLTTVLVLLTACTRSGAAEATPPLPTTAAARTAAPTGHASTDGLSEVEAVAMARRSLSDDNQAAPVWATTSGTLEKVYPVFEHSPGNVEEPLPDNIAASRLVWLVEFKVAIEICPPDGSACEDRIGLTTIIIDRATGEWLRTMTYAPSPGDPLPRP